MTEARKPADWSDEQWNEYQQWLGTLLPYNEKATHFVAIKGNGAAPLEGEEEEVEEEPEAEEEPEEENGDNVAAERE